MSEAKAYPDTIEQVGKVLAQHFSFDFVFLQQILIRRFDRNRTRQMRPHARANLIETKITLGLEVQKNGFACELPHQDMRGNSDGLRKCGHCVGGDLPERRAFDCDYLCARLDARGAAREMPVGKKFAIRPADTDQRYDFFFLVFTLVWIPGANCCSASRPALASLPMGPFGSRLIAFWYASAVSGGTSYVNLSPTCFSSPLATNPPASAHHPCALFGSISTAFFSGSTASFILPKFVRTMPKLRQAVAALGGSSSALF